MKLTSVQVTNFKCVKDSTEFSIDEHVTCLVGKNESGKTAILQALEKLNPVDAEDGHFDILEYPRADMSEYQESEEEANAITTKWTLTDDDVSAVQAAFGSGVLKSTEVVIKKGYYEDWRWEVQIDESKAFENFLASANLHAEERTALRATGSLKAAYALLAKKTAPPADAEDVRSPREQELFEKIEGFGKYRTFWNLVANTIVRKLPKMVYFSEYLRMPGQVSLNDLETRPQAKAERGKSPEPDQDLGTKVGDQVLSTDSDTLFPLRACLGYEITQTLFVGEHTFLVEGPSEVLYIPWFSRKLQSLGRAGLDKRWTLTPCGGVDKIPAFLSLFSGQNLHIATLVDFASGQKNKVDKLRKSQLLRDGHVFTADHYATQPEADIEDVVGRDMYVAIVNECYSLTANAKVPASKAKDADNRVVKEVEHHFNTVATNTAEFDHYRPAEFLTQRGLDVQFPGLDSALDRFEHLFNDLNSLLPK